MGCSETRPEGSRRFVKLSSGKYEVEYRGGITYFGNIKNAKRSGYGELT